ncbi:2-oxoacid:acceptor oxidoreductase family protein [Myxococcota bacterium]|nr:2-oxoacid:acceptor oxidoreductase family protein [Myxococcota bacterium]
MSSGREREVLWTGIGGQGVQLAATILARAGTLEGLEVMSLGTYGGTMRGGNTDATVVLANRPITSPPIVPRAWAAVVAHPRFFDPIRPKLRPDGIVVVNAEILEAPLFPPSAVSPKQPKPAQLLEIKATTLAREADAPNAAALVLLAAFATATGIVSLESLAEALASALPAYRSQFLEANRRALAAGARAVPALCSPAWAKEAA